MERILIFIKHHINFLWKVIENVNGLLFHLFYGRRVERVLPDIFSLYTQPPFLFRRLKISDTGSLFDLLNTQKVSDLEYFDPHRFDPVSLRKQFRNRSFLMMGVFNGEVIVGYFFLRFFANKKCFVGRLIDTQYRGKGIGLVMNRIMYETAWRMGFRCLSTISRKNKAVIKAHERNSSMVILKELQDDYLLVEFVREHGADQGMNINKGKRDLEEKSI